MKKVKHATQKDLEKIFPRKSIPDSNKIEKEEQDEEEHNCTTCGDKACKAGMILSNLMDSIEFAEQIGHHELYNILLTLHCVLKNLHLTQEGLVKLEKVCQEIYADLNPKEVKKLLN